MRFSEQQITNLQVLLKELTGKEYSREQAQEAGIAVMRFAAAKLARSKQLSTERNNVYGNNTRKEVAG